MVVGGGQKSLAEVTLGEGGGEGEDLLGKREHHQFSNAMTSLKEIRYVTMTSDGSRVDSMNRRRPSPLAPTSRASQICFV
jgi:hypothetical protein